MNQTPENRPKKSIMRFGLRIVVGVILAVAVFSCARVPSLQNEITGNVIRVPFVRVLLGDNQSKARVSAASSFAVECLTNGEQAVYHVSGEVTISNQRRRLTVTTSSGQVIHELADEVNAIPRGAKNRLSLDGKRYRGLIQILPDGASLKMINIVYMEDYLRGVVPPEIGRRDDSEFESVKAQAVASRTYALAHLKQYVNEQYDMKSSIIDQVYQGLRVENKLVNNAIDATAGNVLMYQDDFVQAYYHSTCGGMTDNISHVWERPEVPYLKAVEDGGACSWSKYYNWKEVFSESQLRGRIEQYLASDRGRDLRIGRIKDIVALERTPGGRIAKLIVKTDNDSFYFRKDRIRWVIGRTSNPDLILPSDRFDVAIERDADGYVSIVTISGRGYGHGVGMCQCGAIGLSRQGWTFSQILEHYYTGSEVRVLY